MTCKIIIDIIKKETSVKGVIMSKKEKQKMTRDVVPENFTLSMALVDAIPVIFFGLSMIAISRLFDSTLFLIAAILIFASGAGKVFWKIIVALKKKNIWFFFIQMRILMPLGFVLLIASLFVDSAKISLPGIISGITGFPAVIFFVIGILGMVMMGVFAKKLDSSDAKSNWIEQLTNGIAQAAIFIGILLIK